MLNTKNLEIINFNEDLFDHIANFGVFLFLERHILYLVSFWLYYWIEFFFFI